MIVVHSNPNSKMKNTLFLVVLFAIAQHGRSLTHDVLQCQAGKKSYCLLTYLIRYLLLLKSNHGKSFDLEFQFLIFNSYI